MARASLLPARGAAAAHQGRRDFAAQGLVGIGGWAAGGAYGALAGQAADAMRRVCAGGGGDLGVEQVAPARLQVRLVCSSPGPRLIEALVIDEVGLTEALPPHLSFLATRDVYFKPPILLRGPGSFMCYTLNLPASQDEAAAPRYRLSDVTSRAPAKLGEIVIVPTSHDKS